MLRTVLTERLGIALPIVQTGLGPAGRPSPAASVSAAGALGMLSGLGALSPDVICREIRDVRARTGRPFGVNLLLNAPPDALQARLAACLEEGVSAVSFFGRSGTACRSLPSCRLGGAGLRGLGWGSAPRRGGLEVMQRLMPAGRMLRLVQRL